MSKVSKVEKRFVRNPNVPIRTKNGPDKRQAPKKVHFEDAQGDADQVDQRPKHTFLNTPEFLTILQLANEVDRVRNLHCSAHDLTDKAKCNLNFSSEEKVYQNLVDLNVPEEDDGKSIKSQNTFRFSKKDPEPDYQSLLRIELQPEYVFSCYAPQQTEMGRTNRKKKSDFNGFSLYNQIKSWQKENFSLP